MSRDMPRPHLPSTPQYRSQHGKAAGNSYSYPYQYSQHQTCKRERTSNVMTMEKLGVRQNCRNCSASIAICMNTPI